MNSVQYEELARYFLSEKTGIAIEEILSVVVPNPRRPGLPEYAHQIDLYWETEDDVCRYLNIANAKWRSDRAVEQGEVMLLQQVRQKVAAHKAVMITSTGFTEGAIAAAKDDGIALHVVAPTFDCSSLPTTDRNRIQTAMHQAAATSKAPICKHEVVHKALERARSIPGSAVPSGYPTSAVGTYATRMVVSSSTTPSNVQSSGVERGIVTRSFPSRMITK